MRRAGGGGAWHLCALSGVNSVDSSYIIYTLVHSLDASPTICRYKTRRNVIIAHSYGTSLAVRVHMQVQDVIAFGMLKLVFELNRLDDRLAVDKRRHGVVVW